MRKTSTDYDKAKRIHMREGELLEVNYKPLSGTVGMHWHDYYEMEAITGESMIEYTVNGQTHYLQQGAVYLVSPQDLHAIRVISQVNIYSLSFNGVYIAPKLLALLQRAETGKIAYFSPATFRHLESMLALLKAEFDGTSPLRSEILTSLISSVLYLYLEHAQTTDAKGKRPDLLVANIVTIINASFREKLTVRSIAEQLYLTPNYIGERFKKAMGKSISDFIMETRLVYAYNLLRSGEYNVIEAAEHSGFGSATHFSTSFKKRYGFSPRQMTNDTSKRSQTDTR